MFKGSDIFEKHYTDYCDRISEIDMNAVKEILGAGLEEDILHIRFFNRNYRISGDGITDEEGAVPHYTVCVILAKYVLHCPARRYHDTEWVSFKDFKKDSHFTNTNFFSSDTEQAILKHFSGRVDALKTAGNKINGQPVSSDFSTSYDLSMAFEVLPRLSLLLLFNDRDEEFPAQCTVLFHRHAEYYLDPESLLMTSAALARRLVDADQNK